MKGFDKRIVKDRWWLALFFFLGIFVNGFQLVPVLTLLYIPCVIYYARRGWAEVAAVTVVNTFSSLLAFLSLLDTNVNGPRWQNKADLFAIIVAFNIPFAISLAADQVAKDATCIWPRIFTFPTMWAGMWMVFERVTPIGDVLAYSNAFIGWSDFIQIVSLGGRPLVDFLFTWFATTLYEIFFYDTTLDKPEEIEGTEDIDDTNVSTAIRDRSPPLKKSLYIHSSFALFGIVLLVSLVIGGAKVNIRTGSFFHKQHASFVPQSVPVGCMVGPQLGNELQNNHSYWFNKTAELAESGARIVLWSEVTAAVDNIKDRAVFLEQAKHVARTHSILLGVSYDQKGPVPENKVTLISPNGDIIIDFNKAHPVPGTELQAPGELKLPFVDTEEFGRIGLAICFDFNFPDFIGLASKNNIDLMLQPAWTWGPAATYIARSSSIRAIENGFTLFRCASQGVSGIFEPTAAGMFNQQVGTLTDQKIIFNLPLQKRTVTLYGHIGSNFGNVCLVSAIGGTIALLVKKYRKNIALGI